MRAITISCGPAESKGVPVCAASAPLVADCICRRDCCFCLWPSAGVYCFCNEQFARRHSVCISAVQRKSCTTGDCLRPTVHLLSAPKAAPKLLFQRVGRPPSPAGSPTGRRGPLAARPARRVRAGRQAPAAAPLCLCAGRLRGGQLFIGPAPELRAAGHWRARAAQLARPTAPCSPSAAALWTLQPLHTAAFAYWPLWPPSERRALATAANQADKRTARD